MAFGGGRWRLEEGVGSPAACQVSMEAQAQDWIPGPEELWV